MKHIDQLLPELEVLAAYLIHVWLVGVCSYIVYCSSNSAQQIIKRFQIGPKAKDHEEEWHEEEWMSGSTYSGRLHDA
ncbi:MAG TPA: hypothetical protein VE130_15875 [Nitrososphaeraceae archaeon]|jgi:hypothetical protein|nr:hypothetical protein [Nitrososphaeraceae archaeon]